ncbi:MAG: hypothetical protein JWO77_436 [Ilumatobacteraceae bacterium]|nr:hypothetical protein [Ilumatobacteraceae bacterium]
MRTSVHLNRPAPPALRPRHGLVAVLLAAGVLVGCGSSAKPTSQTGDATFCAAIDDFVEASKTGDRTTMADVLDGTVEGLPTEGREKVSAYVTALRSSPANDAPDGDGVESDATDTAFRDYVAEACGADVELPGELDATTTTAAPPSSGSGSTDGTSMDGGPVDGAGDTGTGGGSGTP